MGIFSGSQIVICDLPIRLDTYKGCSHACKYCFVKKKTDISDIEVDNSLIALKKFINGERTCLTNWCDWKIPLHWGGMSDPFQPCEKKHKASLECLKIFKETQYPFVVSTKGKLIAESPYIDLIRDCNCVVQFSIVSSKYDVIEKGAPKFAERLEIVRKIAQTGKRVIARVQPYMTEVHSDVLENLQKFKYAGVYGITIEGMKFSKPQNGLIKLGNDFVYPKNVLERKFKEIKEKCHKIGLKFYCAENRLRTLGDDMCCCGIDGLEGFTPNKYNLEHILNEDKQEPNEVMKKVGSAQVFASIFQNAGAQKMLKKYSFSDVMMANEVIRGYEPIIKGGLERNNTEKEVLRFTRWLKSTGLTAKEVNELTNTQMSSHWLCTTQGGQCEVPTPQMFELLKKSHKIKGIPDYIKKIVYGNEAYIKKIVDNAKKD